MEVANIVENNLPNGIEIVDDFLADNKYVVRFTNNSSFSIDLTNYEETDILNKLKNITNSEIISEKSFEENSQSQTIDEAAEKVQSEFGVSLKNKIIDNIKSKNLKDFLSIARIAYIELNKSVHYNYKYVTASRGLLGELIQKKIYKENTTFNSMTSDQIVCSAWSSLYSELLQELGVPSEAIQIVGRTHKWVEVSLTGNQVLIADASVTIHERTDLVNCKYGDKTAGFVIRDNKYSGKRIDWEIDGKWDGSTKPDEQLYQLATTYWKNIDKKIGYATNGKYYADNLTTFSKLFGNSALKKWSLSKKYNFMKDIKFDSNMDGFEAERYLNTLKLQIFGNMEDVSIERWGREIDGSLEGCVVMKMEKSNYYMIYSQSLGKVEFSSYVDMLDYIKRINIYEIEF